MHSKSSVLSSYVALARKLGKLPSKREVIKFICSYDTVVNYFDNLPNLKKAALAADAGLEFAVMPAELTLADVEAYRLGLEKSKRTKKNVKLVKDVSVLEYISRFSENVFSGRVTPLKTTKEKKIRVRRAINLTLSDLHFGSDIKKDETGYLDYGATEEARRFAAIIKQTIEYKQQHREDSVLHVNLLGDIIQNKLHDPQDAAPMAEQTCRAIHLLIQGFALLGEHFPIVYVHCASGNHGRDISRHHGRATSGKWDSVETVIYYAVKSALKDYANIIFDIPKTPFVVYDIFGNKVFATHGDNVLKPGNPGKSLNIGGLQDQINGFNAALTDNDEIKVAIVGHTHCGSLSQMSSGAYMITNGCLPPVDQFAVSIGILENRASQTIFEMTGEHAVGDIRFITVGEDDDNNVSLSKLIKPWQSF